MTLYFEDLSVGDRHEVGGYTVSKDEIVETTPSESRDDRGYVEFERHVHTDTEVTTVRSYDILRKRPE